MMPRSVLSQLIRRALTRIYFRSTTVHGTENLPRDGAVLLACTHRNGAVDGLIMESLSRFPAGHRGHEPGLVGLHASTPGGKHRHPPPSRHVQGEQGKPQPPVAGGPGRPGGQAGGHVSRGHEQARPGPAARQERHGLPGQADRQGGQGLARAHRSRGPALLARVRVPQWRRGHVRCPVVRLGRSNPRSRRPDAAHRHGHAGRGRDLPRRRGAAPGRTLCRPGPAPSPHPVPTDRPA